MTRAKVATVGLVVLVAACSGTRAETPPTDETQRATATQPQRATATQPQAVNPRGAATKVFLDRIETYVTFHNNVEKMVPPLTETIDPTKIAAREQALGAALIKSRPNAQQGDFFIKQYQPYLMEMIKEDFAKRSLADRKALIVELPKGVSVGVNQVYPTTIPLATFPPKLLQVLPELPKILEYRIVFRDLILRDVKGNVVVDVMPNAFPIPVSTRR